MYSSARGAGAMEPAWQSFHASEGQAIQPSPSVNVSVGSAWQGLRKL